MNFLPVRWLIFFAFLSLIFSGCTTLMVPPGGSGTVRIIEGGLVESFMFNSGTTLNIQITRENVPGYDYLEQHVLTIGRFSPVIGSGFTSRSNIYFESSVGPQGDGEFMIGREKYRVSWREVDVIPGHRHSVSVFAVTIEQVQL